MSRMGEQAAEQDERENLSGADLCEAWEWEQMQKELEKYVPFAQQFNEFVASQEKQNERL